MLYWFFVKGLGPIAIHRLGPTAQGLENIPHEGGAIIAANHLAVIDDALLPLTCPRMIHFMGKAEYFEGKGIKGKFTKDIPARRVWHSKPVAPLFRPPSSVRVNCRSQDRSFRTKASPR